MISLRRLIPVLAVSALLVPIMGPVSCFAQSAARLTLQDIIEPKA